MLYPEWAALSSEDQEAAVSVQNLGHALTHIRRAIPPGQSPRPRELAEAWKAIDNSAANKGGSDPDGYMTNVRAWSIRVSRVKHADYSEARERCKWAIELAAKFVPVERAANPVATKPATPRQSDQGAGMAPPPRRPLVSTAVRRRPAEAVAEPSRFRPCRELVDILAPAF